MTISFDDLYDAETVDAIESWRSGRGVEPARGWRGGVSSVALVASGLAGVRSALEEEVEPVVEEPELDAADDRFCAVTVHFVPGDPSGTVAVVRPWLLRRPGRQFVGLGS